MFATIDYPDCCNKSETEKIGTLNSRIVVNVIETRLLDDGERRRQRHLGFRIWRRRRRRTHATHVQRGRLR